MSKMNESLNRLKKTVARRSDQEIGKGAGVLGERILDVLEDQVAEIVKEQALSATLDEMSAVGEQVRALVETFNTVSERMGESRKANDTVIATLEKLLQATPTNSDILLALKRSVEAINVTPQVKAEVNFPKELAVRVLELVDTQEIEPNVTNFRRDNSRRVIEITEQYSGFTVIYSYRRDRNGDVDQVTRVVR